MNHSEDYYKAKIHTLETVLDCYKTMVIEKDEQIKKLNDFVRKSIERKENEHETNKI